MGERVIKDYELAGYPKIFNFSIDEILIDFKKELD